MRYRLWIKDEAKAEVRSLPGHIRQRVQRAIQELSLQPRPPYSLQMTPPVELDFELRRLRLDQWRVIYIVDETWFEVGVLAVRKRPPYDYQDLPGLLANLGG